MHTCIVPLHTLYFMLKIALNLIIANYCIYNMLSLGVNLYGSKIQVQYCTHSTTLPYIGHLNKQLLDVS